MTIKTTARASRVVRFPIALVVGYLAGWAVHRTFAISGWAAWIVSAVVFILVLTVLARTVYPRLITPKEDTDG
jgi:hypothetical protein